MQIPLQYEDRRFIQTALLLVGNDRTFDPYQAGQAADMTNERTDELRLILANSQLVENTRGGSCVFTPQGKAYARQLVADLKPENVRFVKEILLRTYKAAKGKPNKWIDAVPIIRDLELSDKQFWDCAILPSFTPYCLGPNQTGNNIKIGLNEEGVKAVEIDNPPPPHWTIQAIKTTAIHMAENISKTIFTIVGGVCMLIITLNASDIIKAWRTPVVPPVTMPASTQP